MRNDIRLCLLGGAAVLALLGWSWPQPKSPAQKPLRAADKPVKIHILYTSDAVGYYEPCG
ncbi:hypothetical protein L0337_12460 [candidate division KSB1 bacterium]|nr:hypothetical protein [candidate division KSB1 bacterium]